MQHMSYHTCSVPGLLQWPTSASSPVGILQVFNPRNKLQQVFVITLGRAGEDNRSFRLTNVDATLEGFAGADYDMLVCSGLAALSGVPCEVGGFHV